MVKRLMHINAEVLEVEALSHLSLAELIPVRTEGLDVLHCHLK